MTWLAILAGGAIGSLLRASLVAPGAGWTASTLTVNALACLVIGWLYARRDALPASALQFGAIGLCGGLSTFSTLAADVARLAQAGAWARALVAPGIEIAAGLVAVWTGERLARRHAARRASRRPADRAP